jgi:hypothetical protein
VSRYPFAKWAAWELEPEMKHTLAFVVLAALSGSICLARSDEYPTLNVLAVCRGIANQSSLREGLGTLTFDQCMQSEQTDRQKMINEWSTFSSVDKKHCIAEATTGGESSYTDLLTCLEMARDVRQEAQSAGKPTG